MEKMQELKMFRKRLISERLFKEMITEYRECIDFYYSIGLSLIFDNSLRVIVKTTDDTKFMVFVKMEE